MASADPPTQPSRPSIAVVVATRDRPVRLRWLLNALQEQTLPPADFEVVIANDGRSPSTRRVLEQHPLRGTHRLMAVAAPPGQVHPGAMRNLAWRRSSAPIIAFTDDDCRPASDWVERALSASRAHPGAIVQGTTLPDPDEAIVGEAAPWVRTLDVSPPSPWTETCNIAYPRQLLEQLGGFDDQMRVGEDTDLGMRALAAGARLMAEPRMLCYHAVEEQSLAQAVLRSARWRDLALLARRHPQVRRHMWGRIWWKPEHAALATAAVGAVGARWRWPACLLTLPWLRLALTRRGYGHHPRALVRSLSELPGRALIDGAEMAALIRGSVRYRALLL